MSKLLRFRCEIISDEPRYLVDRKFEDGSIETKEVNINYILKLIAVTIDYQSAKRMNQYFEKLVGRG